MSWQNTGGSLWCCTRILRAGNSYIVPGIWTAKLDFYQISIILLKCTRIIFVLKQSPKLFQYGWVQGCISCGMCSYPELTKDHVLTSAYVNIFRTITRNALNKSVWRKKDCFWLPLNKHAMNIFIWRSTNVRTGAWHLNWRTGKHLQVLHVLPT